MSVASHVVNNQWVGNDKKCVMDRGLDALWIKYNLMLDHNMSHGTSFGFLYSLRCKTLDMVAFTTELKLLKPHARPILKTKVGECLVNVFVPKNRPTSRVSAYWGVGCLIVCLLLVCYFLWL